MTSEPQTTPLEAKTLVLTPPHSRAALYASAGQAWAKIFAGPALSAMVVLCIAVLAGWITWGYRWTSASEVSRVNYIGGIGALLAVIIGLVYLKLEAGIGLTSLGVKVGGVLSADVRTEDESVDEPGGRPGPNGGL